MNSGDNAWFRDWHQFVVDVLLGAATIIVAFAALGTGTATDSLYSSLVALALVGVCLLLEPDMTARLADGPWLRLPIPAEAEPARA